MVISTDARLQLLDIKLVLAYGHSILHFSIDYSVLITIGGDMKLNPCPAKGSCKYLHICHMNMRSLSRAQLLAIKTS